ncbi:MAG: RecB-family nuclease [Candidatus Methanomethylicia archaeon]
MYENVKNLIMVIHNIHSPQRLIELAKVFYGLGYTNLVISKAAGAAAQMGIPEVQKISIKTGGKLIITTNLEDAIELIKPNIILLATYKPYGKTVYKPEEIARKIMEGLTVMIVIGGLEPGLTSKELSLGETIYVNGIESDIGCVGLATIIIYELKKKIDELNK